MRSVAALVLIVAALILTLACGDDEGNVLERMTPTGVATTAPTVSGGATAATSTPARTATTAPAATATPAVQPTPATTAVWSAASVFDPTSATPDAWLQACGVPLPALPPNSTQCVETIMRQMGAAQSAIDFLEQQDYLLQSFEERGRIDYGRGSAPWFNMARPTQQLFLNGQPDVIEVGAIPDRWKTESSYTAVVAAHPNAFPWTEYGRLTAQRENGSTLTFEIAYPLQDCRACMRLGAIVMAYDFDAQGRLTAERLLPFAAN